MNLPNFKGKFDLEHLLIPTVHMCDINFGTVALILMEARVPSGWRLCVRVEGEMVCR